MQNEQGKMRNEIKLKKRPRPVLGRGWRGTESGLYWIRTSDPMPVKPENLPYFVINYFIYVFYNQHFNLYLSNQI